MRLRTSSVGVCACSVIVSACLGSSGGNDSTSADSGNSGEGTDGTGEGDVGEVGSGSEEGETGEETGGGRLDVHEPPQCGARIPIPDCPNIVPGELQSISYNVGTYLVRPPSGGGSAPDLIMFMPGGQGQLAHAQSTYDAWLGQGEGIDEFIVAVPYVTAGSLDYSIALDVALEIQQCVCSSGRIHLGGTSNGGRGAYDLMLSNPDYFVSLLGAPGVWDPFDQNLVEPALAGKAVFNAVGELDDVWKPDVQATHQSLLDLGIDSTYLEMAGQGHILDVTFDETVFFDWWKNH